MTCKINADTTNGLKLESDTSGIIELQSNGVTKVTFDASGNMTTSGTIPSSALTGTLPALNGSALTSLASANLTGALPALDGSALTGIATGLTATTFSQAQNGYIKLSNNLLIQWGRASSLANGGARTVNFPITFPTACWAVAASWGVQTSGTWHSAFPSINTTRFTAHNVSGSTQSCWFIAVGK